ncbi:Hypothetical protein PHPALM_3145 [Phytophthora palmivora]|uniref:Uncharacterized protein n=1 Tax=Phytophthora palmivora TaxID=4796 RepID=A0A2P4YN46_9STRA|nr:Hypothetical protein PHPALM_3145 [Phytophthora palmivora]
MSAARSNPPRRRTLIHLKPNDDVNMLQGGVITKTIAPTRVMVLVFMMDDDLDSEVGELNDEVNHLSAVTHRDGLSFLTSLHGDRNTLSKQEVKSGEEAFRAMQRALASMKFEADPHLYPGLGAEEARHVAIATHDTILFRAKIIVGLNHYRD